VRKVFCGKIRLAPEARRASICNVKEVYSNPDFTRVGYYKSVLNEAGIENFIRNESIYNMVVVPGAAMPSLCVADESDYERAVSLLVNFEYSPVVIGADWHCEHCHESVPASFASCWKCQALRPVG
jgi:hypothetical protein